MTSAMLKVEASGLIVCSEVDQNFLEAIIQKPAADVGRSQVKTGGTGLVGLTLPGFKVWHLQIAVSASGLVTLVGSYFLKPGPGPGPVFTSSSESLVEKLFSELFQNPTRRNDEVQLISLRAVNRKNRSGSLHKST